MRTAALALFLATLPSATLPRPTDTTGTHAHAGWRQSLRQEPLSGLEADPRPNPEEALILAEEEVEQAALMDRVRAAVASLPADLRAVIECRYRGDGLTQAETGRHLGLARETVRDYERRALERLRATLATDNTHE